LSLVLLTRAVPAPVRPQCPQVAPKYVYVQTGQVFTRTGAEGPLKLSIIARPAV